MILLVNDDGVQSPAFRALHRALAALDAGPVVAAAPASERSGQSHAITLDRPLHATPVLAEGLLAFSVDGTPVDAVKLALDRLCRNRPQLVVSGINEGPNVGRSILYSGTVAAALEAAVLGLPALAASRGRGGTDHDAAARRVAALAARMLGQTAFIGKVVNCNLPAGPAPTWGAPRSAHHGSAGFTETYRLVAGDRPGYLLHGEWRPGADDDDAGLLAAGHPVLTMLAPDLNAANAPLARLLTVR